MYMLCAKCRFAPSFDFPLIPALCSKSRDRATHIAQTLPAFSACRPHIALSPPLVLSSQASADCLPAKVTACRSWFAFAPSIPYAASRNQGATPSSRFTKLTYAYLRPGTTRSSLSSGKQSASLRRLNKSAEKACVHAKYAGLARHMRFVCAIPGLLHGRALRKKIRGWRKSALCA